MANEYVSAATLKTYLGITVSTYDAAIAESCASASKGIDGVCQRRFWADSTSTVERYYTAPYRSRRLVIEDLVTLGSVKTDSSGDGTFATTLTQNTDYVLLPLNAAAETPAWPYTIVELHSKSSAYFPPYPRNVKVTGKFGWAAVPDEIVRATTILATKLFKRQESPFGFVTAGVDNDTAMRIAKNDPDVRFLIEPYMRVT